jgi:hypothetical protein
MKSRYLILSPYRAGIAISVSLVLAMLPPPVWFTPPPLALFF